MPVQATKMTNRRAAGADPRTREARTAATGTAPRLGDILVARHAVTPSRLRAALALQKRASLRLGELLLQRDWVTARALSGALALQRGTALWRPDRQPPSLRLIDRLGPETCLRWGCVPLHSAGGATVVAASMPESFESLRPRIEARLGPVRMIVAEDCDVTGAIVAHHDRALLARAETRTPGALSCRTRSGPRRVLAGSALAAALGLAVLAPLAGLLGAVALATAALVAMTGLRLAAAASQVLALSRRRRTFRPARAEVSISRLPVVSLIVALYDEPGIIDDCIQRLSRLSYPKDLTDVVLAVEAEDTATLAALQGRSLPGWIRVIAVPRGTIRTKPRALNYALDFCRGVILGIYDAEDAPEPDQLERVVARFYASPGDVACLQGRLDFYNPRQNWLSRCFALDYAAWFGVLLPGLARLGFAIPLGGTTVFFRREALEALGGWDAHNVTEDADLGIRLARCGYRTELLDSTTFEEANCRPGAWIRQRARWLKGYAMTYRVHMRDPGALWRELGPRRFFGFQVLMGGTLVLYLLAPVLWSFLLVPLGLPHPLEPVLGPVGLWSLAAVFAASEAVSLAATLLAVSGPRRRWLMPWALTLQAYFALGAVAAVRAAVDMVARPFYWDKTRHGLSQDT